MFLLFFTLILLIFLIFSNFSVISSLQSAQKLLRLAGITFQEFEATLAKLHKLDNECSPIDQSYTFKIFYTDPKTSTLLPINNDDNLARAIASSQFHSCQKNNNSSFLRIYIYNSANQPNINNNSVHNQSTDSHNDSDTARSEQDRKQLWFGKVRMNDFL